jgi:hypothetical protein
LLTRLAAMLRDITPDYEKIQQVNQLVDWSNGRRLHVDFEPNESASDARKGFTRAEEAVIMLKS